MLGCSPVGLEERFLAEELDSGSQVIVNCSCVRRCEHHYNTSVQDENKFF